MKPGHKLKSALKRGLKRSVILTGGLLRNRAPASRILTYHSVGNRDHEMNVAPADFKEQMQWLAGHHEVIDVAQAAQGRPGVAITFDDGYADNLTVAAPTLQSLGLSATVFVVAGRLGALLDHDTDPETSILMTPRQLVLLEEMGLRVEGHGMSHCRLAGLDRASQEWEIAECAKQLEACLGHPLDGFAYPYGSALDYDRTSMALVEAAGYTYALSNRYGVNTSPPEPFELRRIWIDRSDSLQSFKAKVEGKLDGLRWLDSRPAARARRVLNRLLGTR